MQHVVLVAPKGRVNLSSLAGSYEILNKANLYWQRKGHRAKMNLRIAGFVKEVELDAGMFAIRPENLSTISSADLVLVPAVAPDENLIRENRRLITWIREQHAQQAEIATMCSGAFLLAATGLLDGKSCSTNWNLADKFRQQFPKINLLPDSLITTEKGIYTNGGAYSFLHLMLFLVEKYFDRDTAIYCSKIFQIDIDRTSQSPFLIFETQKTHGDEVVSRAQSFIEKNLSRRISFEALATQLATSRRNFDRRFIKATGNTPVEYLQRVKIEVAKRSLEKGRKSVLQVMDDVGYSDEKAFREVFKRFAGMAPLDYREKYRVRTLP